MKYPAAISFQGVTAISVNAVVRLGVPLNTLVSLQALADEPSISAKRGGDGK
ncbi:hypothetical protein ACCS85_26790 [Rhizobium ruizarguesonis]